MAALFAILTAISKAVKRDLGTLAAVKVNNFFLFIALLMWGAANSGVEPKSAEPLLLLLGFLLLFPLSSDPLAKIPPTRLALWPLSNGQRFALRIASLIISPVLWLAVLLLLRTKRFGLAAGFVGFAIAIQAVMVLGRQLLWRVPQSNLLHYIPRFPSRLGGLIQNNIRQLLSVMDFYVTLIMALGAYAYRYLNPHSDPEAFPVIAIFIGLLLSTFAQCFFGFDLGSGITRYRLMPLRGWQLLLAKDIAFLGVLAILVAPMNLASGITFGLSAVAIGHHPSVMIPQEQYRWRFTGSRLFPGVVQAIVSIAIAFAEKNRGPAYLGLAAAMYVISLFVYGYIWDRRGVR